MPALTVTKKEMDRALAMMKTAIQKVEAQS
jgi:hypothetical protein